MKTVSNGGPAYDALVIEHEKLLEAAMKLVEHTEAMYRKYARGVVPREIQVPINAVKEQAGCL